MLRISKLADYATLIMSTLAADAERLLSASVLAKQLGLSPPVVSKVLKILLSAELLTSVRGAEGGYRLARPAEKINLAQIVEAIEGNFGMTECCMPKNECSLVGSCSTQGNWKSINQVIYKTLAQMTLAEMKVNHG